MEEGRWEMEATAMRKKQSLVSNGVRWCAEFLERERGDDKGKNTGYRN